MQKQGFNPNNLQAEEVEFDLATDSWFLLETPWIQERLQQLAEHSSSSIFNEGFLRNVFPFAFLSVLKSGKAAESCLCKAFSKRKKIVLQNLLFPTMIYNEITNGFEPREIPVPEVYHLYSNDNYKGNMDLERLKGFLEENNNEIAFVCIEVCNNAAGGQPVTLNNFREIKKLISHHQIPLVIDVTRVVENAVFNYSSSQKPATNQSIWSLVRQICTYANVITASLTKDFGVKQGGLIATNDGTLFENIQIHAREENLELSEPNQQLLSSAFQDLHWVEARVKQRMEQVCLLGEALQRRGIPVVTPYGGHCILVNVLDMQEFARLDHPLASFLAWLYQYTGIRGGIHCTGISKNPPLDGVVRLSVPVGMPCQNFERMVERIEQLDWRINPIPSLTIVSKPAEIGGEAKAEFKLQEPNSLIVDKPELPKQSSKKPLAETSEAKLYGRRQASQDIAIIGVSGRYPMADSIKEFWNNLVARKDCITERPLGRWNENLPQNHERVPKTRWGGFINDVDKFDSMFFNISPRDAELLDPQERLFLEIAWETLEDAGYYPENLPIGQNSRNVGVFVGAVWQLYQMLGVEEIHKGNVQTPNSLMWNIANRVSSFMNFNGPSLTVDTACSGALAAIHLACQSIRNGECQAAIAGGVNLDLHALKWLLTEASGFLSEHGRCKAFGEDAKGYVPGEGVGAILLKPLEQAIADRDHIYAVIKSCVFNHGGRASGYTAPNPNAQADLVASAIREADIDARTIGYIETHGTGTQLGDPVEIQGLTKAFREFTADNQFCSLGSVKSNIGHLEAAAGIAGLTKVLLQLKYKKIVSSLHSNPPNSLINFANSPFYVQQNLTDWQPVTINGKTYPRRSGISSFGAGGSNLHIILEEYQNPDSQLSSSIENNEEELIVLSARDEEQLRNYARRMQQFLEEDLSVSPAQQQCLRDIAFTLQVGRKPMSYRLAIIASSKKILLDKLNRFLNNKNEKVEGLFIGNVKGNRKVKNTASKEVETSIDSWVQNHDYDKLAQSWIEGLTRELNCFADIGRGKRISLPTYPFARDCHWLISIDNKETSEALEPEVLEPRVINSLHPLIDTNESTLEKVTFQKLINPSQYVFRDHVVDNYPTLPGVAYIEMGCVAGELAAKKTVRIIKNLIWAAPINLESSPNIYIEVHQSHSQDVRYEVYTVESNQNKIVHAQGKLGYEYLANSSQPQTIDLEAIRQRCPRFTSKQKCYEMLHSLKFNYGTCLQAIAGVEHNEVEGLTKLVLPEPLHEEFSQYHLHPSLMDGAVQSIIAVMQNEEGYVQTPYLPFVVGKVEIFQPLTKTCFAYTAIRKGERDINTIKKVDVTLVNEQGEVLLIMSNFALKAFNLDDIDPKATNRQMQESENRDNLFTNGYASASKEEQPTRIYVSSFWQESLI